MTTQTLGKTNAKKQPTSVLLMPLHKLCVTVLPHLYEMHKMKV